MGGLDFAPGQSDGLRLSPKGARTHPGILYIYYIIYMNLFSHDLFSNTFVCDAHMRDVIFYIFHIHENISFN